MHFSDSHRFRPILLAYLLALSAAGLTVVLMRDMSPLLQVLVADVVATLVIFAFSRLFDNSSFYDAYWSVAPPLIAGYWIAHSGTVSLREVLCLALIMVWAVRLTHNWARGWHSLSHQDWRYTDLKHKTGVWYPLVDLFGIHLFPTLLVFAGCVPVYLLAYAPSTALSMWDLPWLAIGAGAVYLEGRADNVLRRFRAAGGKGVLDQDVWRFCRHPNYLGELGFWLSLALAGQVAVHSPWNAVGFGLMLALFWGISIPMIERRHLERRGAYAEYCRRVPMLLPLRLR